MSKIKLSTDEFCNRVRVISAVIINKAKASHIGGVYSSADIIGTLYNEVLEQMGSNFKHTFILSKGHCCAGVYAALNLCGIISNEEIMTYGQEDSRLMAHISHKVPTVHLSTGSLGHGLSYGLGKAIAYKYMRTDRMVYVLLSDGELDEGSNWEAFMFGGFKKIDNIVAIIDYNKLQSLASTYETLDLEPLVEKLESFGWHTLRINGHDTTSIKKALCEVSNGKPKAIICDTIKGYPISFMMNKVKWHYTPPNDLELNIIMNELEE